MAVFRGRHLCARRPPQRSLSRSGCAKGIHLPCWGEAPAATILSASPLSDTEGADSGAADPACRSRAPPRFPMVISPGRAFGATSTRFDLGQDRPAARRSLRVSDACLLLRSELAFRQSEGSGVVLADALAWPRTSREKDRADAPGAAVAQAEGCRPKCADVAWGPAVGCRPAGGRQRRGCRRGPGLKATAGPGTLLQGGGGPA